MEFGAHAVLTTRKRGTAELIGRPTMGLWLLELLFAGLLLFASRRRRRRSRRSGRRRFLLLLVLLLVVVSLLLVF